MLTTPALAVKPLARQMLAATAVVALPLLLLALLSYLSGTDTALARSLYAPDAPWAWFMRQYGAFTAGLISWGSLALLLWPKLELRRPLLYKSAAIMVMTAVFGAGLLNQVVVKDMAERPRPRDAVLVDTTLTGGEFKGKSMPSGHAGMAFVLAAPAFVLMSRRRKLATAVLAGGIIFGSVVGVARMVSGAHFASDVLVAAAISLGMAAGLAPFILRMRLIPRLAIALLVLGVGGAFVLGNKFTMNLSYTAHEPWQGLELPCLLETRPTEDQRDPTISMIVEGYGAPLSQLRLVEDDGIIRLQTEYGLYHSLSCEAILLVPATD